MQTLIPKPNDKNNKSYKPSIQIRNNLKTIQIVTMTLLLLFISKTTLSQEASKTRKTITENDSLDLQEAENLSFPLNSDSKNSENTTNKSNKNQKSENCDEFTNTDFIQEFKTKVRPILDLYDELREILRLESFEFPKILVVGDQSAGKTSVLEAISKLNLPRGESTTTKCPTVIQLRSVDIDEEAEYALIRLEGQPPESARRIALSEIDQNIRILQDEHLRDKSTSISDTPIYLNVHKRGAPDLTLYDMPGLTYKNPEEARLIREMYIKYLQGQNTIILLVISGTSDFTSSEAISIIKENCKDFLDRTYLIITKADAAAQIDKKFQEKVVNNPLGLRFQPFVVRHRNQEELDANLLFEDAIKKEIAVLSRSQFARIPKETKGTLCLVKKLVMMQKDILIGNKRNLLKSLQNELISIKKKLLQMPQAYSSDKEKYFKILEYFREISQKIYGLFSGNSNFSFNSNELNIDINIKDESDANINNILGTNFFKQLMKYFLDYKKTFSGIIANFLSNDFFKKVKSETDKISNLTLPNLFENINFHKYIYEEIVKTEKSTYELIDHIKALSYKLQEKIIEGIFSKNFRLRYEVIHLLESTFEKKKQEVAFFLSTLYMLEKDKPYTFDDLYLDTLAKTKKLIEKIKTRKNYCDEYSKKNANINSIQLDCEAIQSSFFVTIKDADLQRIYNYEILYSLFAYSSIVKKRFVDYVVRILMNKFVFYFRDNMLNLLEESFPPLDKDNLDLIDVDVSVEEERMLLNRRFSNIQNAIERLNKVR